MIKKLENLKEQNRLTKPLIHCITNPISIHDCANIVLASGSTPDYGQNTRLKSLKLQAPHRFSL